MSDKGKLFTLWRPGIGWVCFVGLLWAYVIQPIALFVQGSPNMDTSGLFQLTVALLGMGGLRTYEKIKGVSRESHNQPKRD